MLIQLTSGNGPTECEYAVQLFLQVLKKEFADLEVISATEGEKRGYKSVVFKSELCNAVANEILGTVQWICPSPFRPKQKRKNWFMGVNALPDMPDSEYEIGRGGVIFQTFKSGGKGGQHVNKTESAVRAIHIDSGLSAHCSDERSQLQNKKKALERLQEQLLRIKTQSQELSENEIFHLNKNLVRGNPTRSYQGSAFIRIK